MSTQFIWSAKCNPKLRSGIYFHKMQPSTSQMHSSSTSQIQPTPPYVFIRLHSTIQCASFSVSPDTNAQRLQHLQTTCQGSQTNYTHILTRVSIKTGDRGIVNRFASVTWDRSGVTIIWDELVASALRNQKAFGSEVLLMLVASSTWEISQPNWLIKKHEIAGGVIFVTKSALMPRFSAAHMLWATSKRPPSTMMYASCPSLERPPQFVVCLILQLMIDMVWISVALVV